MPTSPLSKKLKFKHNSYVWFQFKFQERIIFSDSSPHSAKLTAVASYPMKVIKNSSPLKAQETSMTMSE